MEKFITWLSLVFIGLLSIITLLVFILLRFQKFRITDPRLASSYNMFLKSLWFINSMIILLSILPGLIDFRKIIIGENINLTGANHPFLFNLLIILFPMLCTEYISATRQILLSPYSYSHIKLYEIFHYEKNPLSTASIFIQSILKNIHEIYNHVKGAPKIRDSFWEKEELSTNKNDKRLKNMESFLTNDLKMQKGYLSCDYKNDRELTLFEDMYIDIFEKSNNSFLYQIPALINHGKAEWPGFAADLLLKKAKDSVKILSQYITSIADLKSFYSFYKYNSDHALFSKSRTTERIFINDINSIVNNFKEEVALINNNQIDDLPKGLGELFDQDETIPHLFWTLEWHYKNYWQMYCIDIKNATDLLSHEGNISCLDFMVITMEDYDLVFSVELGRPGIQKFHNIDFISYPISCFYEAHSDDNSNNEERSYFNFYTKIKSKSKPSEKVLSCYFSDPELNEKFQRKSPNNEMINLKKVCQLFETRTQQGCWVDSLSPRI